MRILFNNVLVKPVDPSKIITLSGVELYLDTRFEEQKNAPQAGTVMQIPEKLTFTHEKGRPSLNFDVDMELQVGDKVIFNYNAIPAAIGSGRKINGGYLIPYDMIYVAIRGDQVICVGGSVIVEPVSEIIKSKIIIPDAAQGKRLKTFGIVRYASALPHRAERFRTDINTMSAPMRLTGDGDFLQPNRFASPGDKVYFHFANAIPLQHYQEIHGTLSRQLLYRMKHSDIELIMEEPQHA